MPRRGKRVYGSRAPIGCSIAVLTANRRPVSFLLLTLGHACGVRVHRFQRGRFLGLTGLTAGGFLSLTGLWPEGCGGGFAASFIMPPLAAFLFRAYSQRTADSRQRTADSRQPIADSRQPIADSRQPTADSRQPTADSRQPIADSRQPIADSR